MKRRYVLPVLFVLVASVRRGRDHSSSVLLGPPTQRPALLFRLRWSLRPRTRAPSLRSNYACDSRHWIRRASDRRRRSSSTRRPNGVKAGAAADDLRDGSRRGVSMADLQITDVSEEARSPPRRSSVLGSRCRPEASPGRSAPSISIDDTSFLTTSPFVCRPTCRVSACRGHSGTGVADGRRPRRADATVFTRLFPGRRRP